MIGRRGERGSGISVLAARHDDDDDEKRKENVHFILSCSINLSRAIILTISKTRR